MTKTADPENKEMILRDVYALMRMRNRVEKSSFFSKSQATKILAQLDSLQATFDAWHKQLRA